MTAITDSRTILGLNKGEQSILAAVVQTPLSISDIARVTKLPRTSLLYRLKKLQHRGLAIPEKHGKRILWKTNTQITEVFEDQRVRVHRGIPAMMRLFEDLITLPQHTRMLGLQPDKSLQQSLRKNTLADWLRINEGIKKKEVIVEAVVHEKSVASILTHLGKDDAKKIYESFIGRLEDYVKIPNEFADVQAELYVWNGVAYITNWDKEVTIAIHDTDMVNLLSAMFSCVKELGVRYSQNEKMDRVRNVLSDAKSIAKDAAKKRQI